jgi:TetR/AcrR family transcriptional regulator, regulator of mycofactocin system
VPAHAVVPDRRARKRRATYEAIERAAWELFAENGYAATTIDDICDLADVAPRTFFRYFPCKEAILFGDPHALEDGFRTALLARPRDEQPLYAIRDALMTLAAVVESKREQHLLRQRILREHKGAPIEDRFGAMTEKSTMLRAVIAERIGAEPDEPATRVLAGLAMVLMEAAYTRWIAAGATGKVAALVAETFDELAANFNHDLREPSGRAENPRTGEAP